MAGLISEVVNITISRVSSSLTQVGFGTALVLVETTALVNKTAAYAKVVDVLEGDIFGTDNVAFKAANSMMGQAFAPSQFKIGTKGKVNRDCTQRIVFDAAASAGTFTITIDGQTTGNIAFDAVAATIETAIEALSNVDADGVTVTQNVVSADWTVAFDTNNATTPFAELTVDITGLTGPTSATTGFGEIVAWDAAATAGDFTLTLNGETTDPIAYNASANDIRTALEALDGVASGDVTVAIETAATQYFIVYKDNLYGATNTLTADESGLTGPTGSTVTSHYQGQASETWENALIAVQAYDNQWFGLTTPALSTSAHTADQAAIAAIIDSADPAKVYFARTTDFATKNDVVDISSPSDIAETLYALARTKTVLTYTSQLDEYPECAIMGLQFTKTPGSSTYKFKAVSGITAEDLTTTHKNNLRDKKCNFVQNTAGITAYEEGYVCQGEFIDVIIGIDYLNQRMSELIFTRLTQIEKVPNSDAGRAAIASLIRQALKLYGVDNELIDGTTITVTIPTKANQAPADAAARILRDVEFQAELIEGIHFVYIKGSVHV